MSSPLIVGYQQSSAYTAVKDRQIQVHKLHHQAASGGVLIARSGVVLGSGSNFDVVRDGTNLMAVNIDPGAAQVGTYAVVSPAIVQVVAAASTASARRDLVVLRVYDTESADATSEGKVEIVKGTTTSDPAVPARSLVLAQLDIAANGTSVSVVDRRQFTAAAGGLVPFFSQFAPASSDLAPGTIAYSLSSGNSFQNVMGSLVPIAGQVATLKALRTSTDSIAGSTWVGVVNPAVGINFPAGRYWCHAQLMWSYDQAGSGYCWASFKVNGIVIGGSGRTVGGWTHNSPTIVDNAGDRTPICHTWTEIVEFAGPQTMTLTLEAGFSDRNIWVHSGCGIWATRIGPLS